MHMNGSELLAEAKKRYPLGTEYYCASGDGTKGKLITELQLYCNDEVYGKFAQNDCSQYVYRNGEYAKIISQIVSKTMDMYESFSHDFGFRGSSVKASDDLEFQNPIVIGSKTKKRNPLKIIT